ncbi:MAG: hypothetical protein IJ223_00045 [Clostridia bacterium]|nr:hypothetical protein [Clostridia bacterium]
MSRIKKAMMGRYIMFMTVLIISLTALLLSLSNFTEIQSTKIVYEQMAEKGYVVRNI